MNQPPPGGPDMAQLSDDCFSGPDSLVTLDRALEILRAQMVPVTRPETCALTAGSGRILAENLIAARPVPPHDNSAVDGYAIRAADMSAPDGSPFKEPVSFRVIGRAAAGHPFVGPLAPGTAVRIFTGAMMPDGADTVMMQEDCLDATAATPGADPMVTLLPGIKSGANRRQAGEDIKPGDIIATAGTRLTAAHIGLAAAQGRLNLPVFAPLRVGLFSTGDELRDPGSEVPTGAVYDSNRFVLRSMLQTLGVMIDDLGILSDDPARLTQVLATAATQHDVLISSGGMSVGEEDHIGRAITALGTLHFWRLAIKPGRPVALGQIGRTPMIGLPGNPVAAIVTFARLARPLLLGLAGASATSACHFPVKAGFDHQKKPGRREWVRVRLRYDDDTPVVEKFGRQGAGILSSIAGCTGLVEIAEDVTHLQAGDNVRYLPFSELGLLP